MGELHDDVFCVVVFEVVVVLCCVCFVLGDVVES